MPSQKSTRMDKLVYVLEHADSWVSAPKLAKMLDTSERTVRNYVAEFNRTGDRRIESSGEGYRLAAARGAKASAESGATEDASVRPALASRQDTAVMRRNYVLSRLVNAREEVSVFDLASELYISESTLSSSVMPQVRRLVEQFGLQISTHDFRVLLQGPEQSKRKLLGHIATDGADGYFSSTEMLSELFPDYDIERILASLVGICQRSDLIVNDYALNNLLMHILVIVIRLTSENRLPEDDGAAGTAGAEAPARLSRKNGVHACARRISDYIEGEFGCVIPEADYQQIVLLIALSAEHFDYSELSSERLAPFVGQEFMDAVRQIADETADRYEIPRLDDPILLQLTLHMFNAYQRTTYHVSYPNPLATQIKSEYAPVYDMAVHFAHSFSKRFDCRVDENEIAFISFHIGAHLERCANFEDKASCIVVVERYHDYASHFAGEIEDLLEGEANVVAVMNREAFLARQPECDLVITTTDLPVKHAQKAVIGPILNKRCIRTIHEAVSQAILSRQRGQAREFLRSMLHPELFVRNLRLDGGPDAYIDHLGTLCVNQGFADASFVSDVHLREQVSSTAFTDALAVPHSIGGFAKRSFVCVLHNDAAIEWGSHNVRFVLLIGIAESDMRNFRDAFDIIVETFSSVDKTMGLMQTDGFDEFAEVFCREMA